MPKIADYIENRRKSQKMSLEDLCAAMKLTPNTYRRRLRTIGFYDHEILAAGNALLFKMQLIPNESEVVRITS